MENNLQVAKFEKPEDNVRFGSLIEIPGILDKNKSSVLNASVVVNAMIAHIATYDIKNIDQTVFDAEMEKAAQLHAKLSTTLKAMEEKRKPYTQFFDDVRTMFTTEEGKLKLLIDKIKSPRNAWEKEKFERNKSEKAAQDKLIADKQKLIEDEAGALLNLKKSFIETVRAVLEKMHKAFAEKTNADLPAYGKVLQGYTPNLEKAWPMVVSYAKALYPYDDALFDRVVAHEKPKLFSEYIKTVTEVKTSLIDSIPARLAASDDEKKKHDQEDIMNLNNFTDAAFKNAEVNVQAEVEGKKIDAVLDVSVNASPVIKSTKGASKKKEYVIKTMADMTRILQSYLANDLPQLSVEEARKKFSFAVTAANKRLNEDITIDGIEVTDLFNTTARV